MAHPGPFLRVKTRTGPTNSLTMTFRDEASKATQGCGREIIQDTDSGLLFII